MNLFMPRLMRMLAAVRDVLGRLADAAPSAWYQDRVFRYAAIGAGVTLVAFMIRPSPSHQIVQSPPQESSTAGMSPLTAPPGQGMGPAAPVPPDTVRKIVPGHPLSSVTGALVLDGDRFGTFNSGNHP